MPNRPAVPDAIAPLDASGSGPDQLWSRLADALLTTDDKQRRCIKILLLTALLTLICMAVMAYGAAIDIVVARHVVPLALASILNTSFFYAIVRSGLNQRFAEPTLAFPQAVAAQTLIAGAYAIGGVVHAGFLMVLALVMVFGMFNMRMGTTRIICAYTVMLMGTVMLWRSHTDPLVYPARLELIYFVLTATVIASLSQLSMKLMRMRERLKTQKLALEEALAHIRQMATRDELTGLPNRRTMTDLLGEHALRRSRGGPPFFIAMVDLDHFKSVNDSYGHAVGDQALRVFAVQAQAILRSTDIIGRWGGEEFLLLLPETPPGEPTVGVERLRARLAGTEVCPAVPGLRVAFSCGFARHAQGEAIESTIERADRALYAAKSSGRNRSVILLDAPPAAAASAAADCVA